MAASPDIIEILREVVRWHLSCCHLVRRYTRGAQRTSLLVKHLMDKGDGNRSFADG
jgi:hypothetical protein